MPFGDQGQEPGGLGPAAGTAPPRRGGSRLGFGDGPGGRGRAGGAAAGGDRAFLQHPGAEPVQRGGRGHAQAQQPQQQPAGHGQQGGFLGGQPGGWFGVAGDHPGPDDADQRVAGQRVGGRRHRPDRQVPPARRGRDHVHEHARARRGHVQHPGPDRVAAVQRQRHPQAGEHQGSGVGDRGLQAGDQREPPGRVDQPVLGGEAHRGGSRGQHAQPPGGALQPDARPVTTGPCTPNGEATEFVRAVGQRHSLINQRQVNR